LASFKYSLSPVLLSFAFLLILGLPVVLEVCTNNDKVAILYALYDLMSESEQFLGCQDLTALVISVDTAQSQADDQIKEGRLLDAVFYRFKVVVVRYSLIEFTVNLNPLVSA
jgi:hypothetical protein